MTLRIDYVDPSELREYENNSRTHSEMQVEQICNSIREFGFVNPIIASTDNVVIAGHGRLMAARLLGLHSVPVVHLHGLSERQRRALVIADNKIALNAGWDFSKLGDELSALISDDFDISTLGFNEQEIDALLKDDEGILPADFGSPQVIPVVAHERRVETPKQGERPDDEQPTPPAKPVSKPGDIWLLGDHRLVVGDATNPDDVAVLMIGKKANMVFTDPPYNVRISGLGVSGTETSISSKHGEFVMASGEMTESEFTEFLQKAFSNMVAHSSDGAIHYVCMDWRHLREMLDASKSYGGDIAQATDSVE